MRAPLGTAAALLCAVAVAASARSVRMPITPPAGPAAAAGHTAARRVAQGASFDSATGIFRLDGAASTYAFRLRDGVLEHLHWGGKLGADDVAFLNRDSRSISFDAEDKNALMLEFADFGTGDFRAPTFAMQFADGNEISPMEYVSHEIYAGKPAVDATQPATFSKADDDASTLKVVMRDMLTLVEADLWYTVFHDTDIVTRRVTFRNPSNSTVALTRAMSATVDFPFHPDYQVMQLMGAWSRERFPVSRKLEMGTTSIGSMRGTSSHQANPLVVISEGAYDETTRNHYAANLVYSGNFEAELEVVQTGRLRLTMGINPMRFRWQLGINESFTTPEIVLAYSGHGMGPISRQMHRFYRNHLMRSEWANRPRPIKVNSWEAMYFFVSQDRVMNLLAKPAAELGLDMVVLDDGWFGNRSSDRCCLGDWEVNTNKFPKGLDGLADDINALGLSFGIWMEPESVNRDSDLFRAHPEWALQTPGRKMTESRNQLLLDMTRADVRDFIVESVTKVLNSANIVYLKWDMNRPLTEVSSMGLGADRQGEVYHRFILGVYDVLERVNQAFPEVLLETCSGGGGRFDPGMLYYSPQIWPSDNTDSISRQSITFGTSLAYPISSMGAHVSANPNDQVGRSSSLKTRSLIAMQGVFGYEMTLDSLSLVEQEQVRSYNALRREVETMILFGDMYRLALPTDPIASYMYVDEARENAIVFAFNSEYYQTIMHFPRLRLQGLDADALYSVDVLDNALVSGETLMNAGLVLTFNGDADSYVARLVRA